MLQASDDYSVPSGNPRRVALHGQPGPSMTVEEAWAKRMEKSFLVGVRKIEDPSPHVAPVWCLSV
jgi:hypothetical protein